MLETAASDSLQSAGATWEPSSMGPSLLLLDAIALYSAGRDTDARRCLSKLVRDGSAKALLHDLVRKTASDTDVKIEKVAGWLKRYQQRQNFAANNPDALTERQLQVLAYVREGLPNLVIANVLAVTEETVKWHLKNAYAKLLVRNRFAAVKAAEEKGLFQISNSSIKF